MDVSKLLPVTPGKTVSQWADVWLADIMPEVTSIILEDMDSLRRRNERLSSYMPTLTVLLCKYGQELDKARRIYLREHPKPEKGITDWRESQELAISDIKRYFDMIESVHEDIGRRLSVAQTTIRTTSDELRHGVR